MPPAAGTRLDNYELIGPLGERGMSEIYQAIAMIIMCHVRRPIR
jgi:hypothetical protein